MAFYCKNLENIIFSKHESLAKEPDKLVIISGYVGPSPVQRLKELPFKTVVIAGMYKNGVNPQLYESLKQAEADNKNLKVLFSKKEVHSKIYIWFSKDEPKYVLIGSANFSNNGLLTDFRESLADMDLRDVVNLLDYYHIILENSTDTPELANTNQNYKIKDNIINNKDENNGGLSVNLPLFRIDSKTGDKFVPDKSGLNWGNSNGHTALGDAYIGIPKTVINEIPDFFPAFDPNYQSKGKKKRNSDPIELLWDDGETMEASAEGVQKASNNLNYPKQLTSYSSKSKKELNGISMKSILGRYLRKRMGISVDKVITYEDLENYGRDNITFSKISEGVYSADFSVN